MRDLCRVSFRLLSEDEQRQICSTAGESQSIRTKVQLAFRHWTIKDAEGRITNQVDGPGVVGKFPILEAGNFRKICYNSILAKSCLYPQYNLVKWPTFRGRRFFWDPIQRDNLLRVQVGRLHANFSLSVRTSEPTGRETFSPEHSYFPWPDIAVFHACHQAKNSCVCELILRPSASKFISKGEKFHHLPTGVVTYTCT